MKRAITLLALLSIMACERNPEGSETLDMADIQSMVRGDDGLYTVTCRDGSTETQVFLGEIQINEVCKSGKVPTVYFQDFATVNTGATDVEFGAPWKPLYAERVSSMPSHSFYDVRGPLAVRAGVLQFNKELTGSRSNPSSQGTKAMSMFTTNLNPTRASIVTEIDYANIYGNNAKALTELAYGVKSKYEGGGRYSWYSKVECQLNRSDYRSERLATLTILARKTITDDQVIIASATFDDVPAGNAPNAFGCMKNGDNYTAFYLGTKISAKDPTPDGVVGDSMAINLQEYVAGPWCRIGDEAVGTCQRIHKMRIQAE